MIQFIKKTILFFAFFGLTFIGIFAAWIIYNYPAVDNPAPNLSNSYSFNEKMLFMKNSKTKKLDALAIGSSMSLNNLHSETIARQLGTKSFINASSWGLNMKDNYRLLKVLNEIYHPNVLLVAANISDFQRVSKTIRYELVKGYLESPFSNLNYYLKTFNMEYYFQNIKYASEVRNNVHDYEYLNYDKYGGMNYGAEDFNINQERWMGDSIVDANFDPLQYQYLDSISTYCENNNIKLYFFQSPFREGYYSNLNEKEKKLIYSHIERIQHILRDGNCTFINTVDTTWSDSLFVDWTHLNKNGAKLFTEYCFDKVKVQKNMADRKINKKKEGLNKSSSITNSNDTDKTSSFF